MQLSLNGPSTVPISIDTESLPPGDDQASLLPRLSALGILELAPLKPALIGISLTVLGESPKTIFVGMFQGGWAYSRQSLSGRYKSRSV